MIDAGSFIAVLKRLNYSQFAGVPCSYLKPFINFAINDPTLDYIGAASEGEAIAISFGAFLAGRKTVTMCQNSVLERFMAFLQTRSYHRELPIHVHWQMVLLFHRVPVFFPITMRATAETSITME